MALWTSDRKTKDGLLEIKKAIVSKMGVYVPLAG